MIIQSVLIQSEHRIAEEDYPIVWINLNRFYYDVDLYNDKGRYRGTTYKAFANIFRGSTSDVIDSAVEYLKRK